MAKQLRPHRADLALNRLEHEWWECNAPIVARFWEMDRSMSATLRRHYLDDVRRFFLDGRSSTTVLELGCGSGWVGQSIAGNGVSIIGTDFSEAQLSLARNNALEAGLQSATSYILASSDDWPDATTSCDSVLIHPFLHHLDGQEVDDFLDALRAKTAPGTRIVLFEPAFYSNGPKVVVSRRSELLLGLAARMVGRINADLRASGEMDEQLRAQFERLFVEANEQGWYLSPKEVPFERDEFSSELAARFDVVRSHWAVIYTIGWAFERNLLRKAPSREHWLWPWVVWIDRQLARDETFLRSRLRCPAHAFHVWHCVRS